jgi:DNA/RNA endonuclease YhcR with UshA esterase domain
MQEKNLYQIAIIAVIIGLAFLYFYSSSFNLNAIARIDSQLPEETVKLQGVIERISYQDKVTFIELAGEKVETIDVVLFQNGELPLTEGSYVEITGTVEEYEGKREVIANSIVLK